MGKLIYSYSFGSPMPNRSFSASSYRYGFNGKEKDDETVGTGQGTQDYGMRIYNPALGRFLSTDPLFKQYPGLTTYQFASNSPIWMIDVDGLEGNPYNGEIPELPADGGRYGKRGIDWDAVANPPGQVPIAVKNAGIGAEGKYYWSSTTDVVGRLIWQKPVAVTTCEDVEYAVVEKVYETIPATPPTKNTQHNSTPPLPHFKNGDTPTNVINDGIIFGGIRANAADKAGVLTSIDVVAQADDPTTQGIVAGLQKQFSVKINLKIDKNLPSDFTYKANYDTFTTTPGKPAETITKDVIKTKTKVVCKTEVKQ